jgi:eukaryotic-like serine/threonine-protein kinase
MPTLSPERWKAVSPYLDQALTLGAEERTAWLAGLQQEDPSLAADLQKLLDEHQTLARREFLEHSPEPVPVQSALEGQTIGAYTLLSPIGQGGMGTVWLARRSDGRYERRVAIKFPSLTLLGGGGGERFKREGSFLGRLAHPHIADLVDAGVSTEGQPYLVLEHVDGDQIDRYCDQKGLDVEARIRLFLDVLGAVAHAHSNLIVHRDIKPSNVLVTSDGQVKLLDFGIAKLLEGDSLEGAGTQLTREGGGAMTPEYAAPEQITGGQVTTATDVYSLGVLLYLLLTGEHPAGPCPRSAAELVKAIVDTEPPRPSDVVRTTKTGPQTVANAARRSTTPDKLRRLLQGDLDTIVAKALKKDPRERYASVTALADDLRRYLKHEPIDARPDTLAYRTAKFVRRNRTAVALASLAVVGPVAFGVAMALQARTITRERDRAERVSEFLVELFQVSDPGQARGNTVTAREVMDRGADRLEKELEKEPEVQASLLETMGRVYTGLGLYQRAEKLLERSGDLRQRILGADHPLTLKSRHLQAWTLLKEGRHQQAEELQSRVLFAQRRVLGEEHRETLQTQNDLGVTLEQEGRAEEAGRIYRQVLEKRLRVLGKDDRETIMSMNNLGFNLAQQGKNHEADMLLREASAGFERLNGRNHPETLWARKNWAQVIEAEGRLPEAEAQLREVLEAQRRLLGVDHADTIYTESILARVVSEQKRFDEAEILFRESLENLRRVLGPAHGRTLGTMFSMATTLYWDQGNEEKAGQLLRETYEVARQAQNESWCGDASYNLGCLAASHGDSGEALDWLGKAIECGFAQAESMSQDPDLLSLHGDPEFDRLVAAAKNNAGKTAPGSP